MRKSAALRTASMFFIYGMSPPLWCFHEQSPDSGSSAYSRNVKALFPALKRLENKAHIGAGASSKILIWIANFLSFSGLIKEPLLSSVFKVFLSDTDNRHRTTTTGTNRQPTTDNDNCLPFLLLHSNTHPFPQVFLKGAFTVIFARFSHILPDTVYPMNFNIWVRSQRFLGIDIR